MAKVKQKRKKSSVSHQPVVRRVRARLAESDSSYFLKLVLVVLVGTFWLKFQTPISWLGIPFQALPLGLLIGLILVKLYERSQADRKIWYAVLIVISVITYFVPAGIVI